MRTAPALLGLLIALAAGRAAAADPAAAAEVEVGPNPAAVAFFRERIWPILADRCIGCHGAERDKGGLRADSLRALLAGGDQGPALVPGDPDASRMIRMVRGEETPRMPPKEPLSAAAVADLVRWVDIGAPWPTAAASPPATAPAPRPASPEPLIARLHPVAVHFPLGLLLVAGLAELLVMLRGAAWRPAVLFCTAAGAAGALAAVITGTALGRHRDYGGLQSSHELMGYVTLALAAAAAVLAWLAPGRPRLVWPLRLCLLLVAAATLIAGHLGGAMTWGASWLGW